MPSEFARSELQTRELLGYCQRRGWQIFGEYVDGGVSGAKDRRPAIPLAAFVASTV